MELDRLIEALEDPAAYPEPAAAIEVRQTHISAVFLTPQHAYKIRKPVELGFLDFSTLAKRRHDCQEEVRLNRRLAADVYLDTVPIVARGGGVRVEGDGPAIEWAVKMRRLPDEATLEHRLEQGEHIERPLATLAHRLADFHARAQRGPHIASFGRYETVERNALENFEQAATHQGTSISSQVFARLQSLTVEALARSRATIDGRAERGVPCDTHGDLRLAHVYFFPDQQPPADLVVVDCIEFNERFRFADPVADMAFLAMGLSRAGHGELAASFADEYFRAAGDDEGRGLLPFYVSYRAAVRGKVDGMQARRPEVPAAEREIALSKARGFWLLALAALEMPRRKPCLVLVGGLPGSGKSTLAAGLATSAGFEVIRSDVVRKELAGERPEAPLPQGFEQGIYGPEWTARAYAECLSRAERLLFEGRRVAVDASFRDDAQRRRFLEAATQWGVSAVFFVCQADAQVVRRRLIERTGDASDADWEIYRQAAERWEAPGALAARALVSIDAGGTPARSLVQAIDALRARGLFD